MSVQSIGKSGLELKSKNGFNPESAFVNMDDNQLKYISYNASVDEEKAKKNRKTLEKIFYAIPIVDTIASGILAPTESIRGVFKHPELKAEIVGKFTQGHTGLGERASSMVKRAGIWAVAILGVTAYNKVRSKAMENSKDLKDFTKEHPALAFITDIGIIIAGFILGTKGLDRVKNAFIKKAPELSESLEKTGTETLKLLDNTHFSKKVITSLEEKAEKLSDKLPFTTGLGKFALRYSPFILFGLLIAKSLSFAAETGKDFNENYNGLKDLQLKTAKHLVNKLGVERDILAQDKKILDEDLKKCIANNEKCCKSQKAEDIEESLA